VLSEVAGRTRPLLLAEQRLVPVLAPLDRLLPGGGLRRGSTVVVEQGGALLLALLAAPTADGLWGAVVGLPSLGLAAAAELGVALERLALVPSPGPQWATVTAALLDAVDVVAVRPPERFRPGDARRLAARARERGAVLMPVGPWIEGAEVRLRLAGGQWRGLAAGHGRLQRRMVEVVATGRGAAARQRQVSCWLPGSSGRVEALEGEKGRVGLEPDAGLPVEVRVG
jgi:hypothetical protein